MGNWEGSGGWTQDVAGSSVGQQEGIWMGEATWQREEGWEPTKQRDGEGAGSEEEPLPPGPG